MANTTKKSNTFIKTLNTMQTVQPEYSQKTYHWDDYNKGMPKGYKATTYEAQTYNGPTVQASEYKSNYKPTTFTNNYKPTEYTDTYNPGQYQSKYMPQIEAALNNVTNFKYDPMQDASYQALAAVYGARGNLAAKNSLADAAALNGGYGTSNAVSAAQQARNQYNQELASYIPQLEQAAYQRASGNLSALQQMDDTLYGRFSDDQARQLQSKQFGLDVAGYNEGNRQFAAQMGLDYDKLNADEKRFVEQNAQAVWGMNRDDAYKAAQLGLDIFNTNTANQQWADQMNQGEHQFRYNSLWDRYNADLANRQWVSGMNQGERQFAYNAAADNLQQASANAWDYLNYLEQQKAANGGGGGGGGHRKSSGGGYVDTGTTSTETEDPYKKGEEEAKKAAAKKKTKGKVAGKEGQTMYVNHHTRSTK